MRMFTGIFLTSIEAALCSVDSRDVAVANGLLKGANATKSEMADICNRLNTTQIEWDFSIDKRKNEIKRKPGGGQLHLNF